eukprot:TRINITY_DN899_c0_g1_i2.p1 TRINITY_DN899_c0_g1~~TRINITY_DN899_c0_g1_i2.p1  ORF type:complete len:343 (-),score=49.44 TRINITY_DN899_c0_g1_i2:27-1055(-)
MRCCAKPTQLSHWKTHMSTVKVAKVRFSVCFTLGGTTNQAVLYCRSCGGYLCNDCDTRLHPASNALMRKHQRVAVESLRPPVMCKSHTDELASYFCMTCESVCICTECVVHGPHRTHDVQNVKRAFPAIRDKSESLLLSITSRIEELEGYLGKIEEHRNEIVDSTQSIKESMSQSFAEIRERLARKEEELMLNADGFCHEQLAHLDDFRTLARDQADEIEAISEVLKDRMKDDDAAQLLNYYGENKEIISEVVNGKDPIMLEIPQMANRKTFLNMDAANAQIDALNGLHLVIASLKGPAENASPTGAASTLNGSRRAPSASQQSSQSRPAASAGRASQRVAK